MLTVSLKKSLGAKLSFVNTTGGTLLLSAVTISLPRRGISISVGVCIPVNREPRSFTRKSGDQMAVSSRVTGSLGRHIQHECRLTIVLIFALQSGVLISGGSYLGISKFLTCITGKIWIQYAFSEVRDEDRDAIIGCTIEEEPLFPILPTLGVTLRF